jgi:hypothetical protein
MVFLRNSRKKNEKFYSVVYILLLLGLIAMKILKEVNRGNFYYLNFPAPIHG